MHKQSNTHHISKEKDFGAETLNPLNLKLEIEPSSLIQKLIQPEAPVRTASSKSKATNFVCQSLILPWALLQHFMSGRCYYWSV